RRRQLVRADVEAAIDGRRIAVDDLAAEAFRQRERERALPGRRRTKNGDDERIRQGGGRRRGRRRTARSGGRVAADAKPSLRLFVVIKGDGEERALGWILRRQRVRRVRGDERAERRRVERVDWTRTHDGDVSQRAVLVDVERDDDVTFHEHRRLGHVPVSA